MTKRILGAGVVMFIFCTAAFQAAAAFYLRPAVQVSSLTDSSVDADIGIGGGLALGAAMGRQQSFDVGAEITATRYKGDFNEPTAMVGPNPVGWTKVPATIRVDSCLATFRYSFTTKNERVRPFLGAAVGFSLVDISKPSIGAQGTCWTASLGGGVSYRLSRLTCIDFGYRYVFSDSVADVILEGSYHNNKFRPNAHVFTVALDQRFGRARR